MNINVKKLKAASRELELESLRQHGPQHGRASTHRSGRDKARCPRRQRKNRNWASE